jgi:hypothetical protein
MDINPMLQCQFMGMGNDRITGFLNGIPTNTGLALGEASFFG